MLVETVVGAFGPFLIPAALFVVGAVGYGIFVLLTRRGVLADRDDGSGETGNG
jgi:hypothetical protein